ncbi:MAG: hypothetical protein AAGJ36_09320 [Pseudomonadota bacterium]
MSDVTPQDDTFAPLAARYRRGVAPAGFADRVLDAVQVPQQRSPIVPAALAAAMLAAVALVVSLPVMGPDDTLSPKWRVSAQTPERPQAQSGASSRLRVALSITTPTRPVADDDRPEPDSDG